MRTALLLLAAAAPAAAQGDDEALDFAWGDPFVVDAATLGEHLGFGLGRERVGPDLSPCGPRGGLGTGYRLSGGGAPSAHLIVVDGSPADHGPLRVQTLVEVEEDADGRPLWDRWARVLYIVRPEHAGLDPTRYTRSLRGLVTRAELPVDRVRTASTRPSRSWDALPKHVVAYGLSRSDVTPGTWAGPQASPLGWSVTGVGHRSQRTVLDLDLADPSRAEHLLGTFSPGGSPQLSVAVLRDEANDPPDGDLGRAFARFTIGEGAGDHPWVGATLDLTAAGAPRDLSSPGVELHLSVSGAVTSPAHGPSLFLVLEDAAGAEAHLPIDLAEVTAYEQEVALPLARFAALEPALDLSALARLGLALRDERGGPQGAAEGVVDVHDLRFVVSSPARLSPLNVFWSNDPRRDADPAHALSDRFLGQPVTKYKYFHGVAGADPATAEGLVADVAAIRANGLTPHVTLELWPDSDARVLDRVLRGEYDPFFRALFGGLARLGGRVELALFHEGNAWWYPWEGYSDPAELRRAFERAAAVRDAERAHNVALGYVVVALPQDPRTLAVAVEAFPGSHAVDFVGLQGFESGYDSDSITFNELFTTSATVLRRITDLPLLVTEFGFSPKADGQYEKGALVATAIEDVVESRTPVPLHDLIYFNVAKTEQGAWRDWRCCRDDGAPVPEMAARLPDLEARLTHRFLRTEGLGRDAFERRLRAHGRVALRLD